MNLYEYAWNSPTNWVDPYGEQVQMPTPGIGVIVLPVTPAPGIVTPVIPLPVNGQIPIQYQPPIQVEPASQMCMADGAYGNPDENVGRGHPGSGQRGGPDWNRHTGRRSGDYEKGDERRDKRVKDKKKKKKKKKKK